MLAYVEYAFTPEQTDRQVRLPPYVEHPFTPEQTRLRAAFCLEPSLGGAFSLRSVENVEGRGGKHRKVVEGIGKKHGTIVEAQGGKHRKVVEGIGKKPRKSVEGSTIE